MRLAFLIFPCNERSRTIVNSIHIYTYFGRCDQLRSNDRLGSAIEIPIAKAIGIFFQPHLRDWINTGSVRKPNLPQCINNYWFYYNVRRFADGPGIDARSGNEDVMQYFALDGLDGLCYNVGISVV